MSNGTRVGWGVIGAGGIARRRTIPEGIVPAANAGLIAVMDVNQDAGKEVAEQFGVQQCADVDALLAAEGVDAVYIATPNHLHKEQVLAAARAGKHVLCEKPLGVHTLDIQEMIQACRDANVLLGVGFMMRFNAYHRKIKEMIANGDLGTPVFARGQMTCWYPPIEGAFRQDPEQGGGGSYVDMGTHVVDVMETFFGKTKNVMCRTFNRVHPYPVEDTALLILEFENGAAAMVDASFSIPDDASEFVLEVYCSQGAVKGKWSLAQLPGGDMQLCTIEGAKGYDAQQEADDKGGYQPWELETKNTYQSEIEALSQAILDGTPAPVPGEAGLWSHIVAEAAYESARTGRLVECKMP